MKLGILFCSYNCEDQLDRCLEPWLTIRDSFAKTGKVAPLICAVSTPFESFPILSPDENNPTAAILSQKAKSGQIDQLFFSQKPTKETEARTWALTWLKDHDCDEILLLDSDEFWTVDQILRTLDFVQANPYIGWFRVAYKNLVFSPNQYLASPFCPPRIFRMSTFGCVASHFYDDNNLMYKKINVPDFFVADKEVGNMTIPPSVAWVKHETWLNDDRSRRKARYQQTRWAKPVGFGCSFAWDPAQGGLIWNEEYFQLSGLPKPVVLSEKSA